MTASLKDLERQVTEAMKSNRPYLIDIERLVNKVKYGTINFSIRVHDARVTDITTQIFQKVRYELGKDGKMIRLSEELPITQVDLEEKV